MTEHVIDDLQEYALDILDLDRSQEVRSHLRECSRCADVLRTISNLFTDAIVEPTTLAPKSSMRRRLLEEVATIAPFSLYHERMVQILAGTSDGLLKELRAMPHPDSWMDGPIPNCRLYPCSAAAGERDAIRTLVLMESGSRFPTHDHLGDETVLVLQGTMIGEEGEIYRPGEVLHMPKGTSHAFDVPEGLDLIYLAVVEQGIQIGEQQILASDL